MTTKYKVWVDVKVEKITGAGTPSESFEDVPLAITMEPKPIYTGDEDEACCIATIVGAMMEKMISMTEDERGEIINPWVSKVSLHQGKPQKGAAE